MVSFMQNFDRNFEKKICSKMIFIISMVFNGGDGCSHGASHKTLPLCQLAPRTNLNIFFIFLTIINNNNTNKNIGL